MNLRTVKVRKFTVKAKRLPSAMSMSRGCITPTGMHPCLHDRTCYVVPYHPISICTTLTEMHPCLHDQTRRYVLLYHRMFQVIKAGRKPEVKSCMVPTEMHRCIPLQTSHYFPIILCSRQNPVPQCIPTYPRRICQQNPPLLCIQKHPQHVWPSVSLLVISTSCFSFPDYPQMHQNLLALYPTPLLNLPTTVRFFYISAGDLTYSNFPKLPLGLMLMRGTMSWNHATILWRR